MKLILFTILLSSGLSSCSQKKKTLNELEQWKKAVVNIETESYILPGYLMDSIYKSKSDSGYSKTRLDSIAKILTVSSIHTGTAIYIKYRNRKYLITAKHVIWDESVSVQKKYENATGANNWDTIEGIVGRVSIRTPFRYFANTNRINNYGVINYNFIHTVRPFFFISDSTGDGIGVVSLQQKAYRLLDTLLQQNGYEPMELETVISTEDLNTLDEIYTVGFPEMVSIVKIYNTNMPVNQTMQLVTPFLVKGSVAMYEKDIQHYYVDLTITPGNSGGPIIKNGMLVGIVSGINKYSILQGDNEQKTNLFGIGHLVNIINIKHLVERIAAYQVEEKKLVD